MKNTQSGPGGSISVMYTNPAGTVFIDGNKAIEGSHRFSIDTDTGNIIAEELISDIWQPASLDLGSSTLWLRFIGLAGIGHHLVTETADGQMHLHSYSPFNGQVSTGTTRMPDLYQYTERMIVVPDNSGEWTGIVYNYNYPSADHRCFRKVYYQTGSTPATSPVRFRVWEGSDDTGTMVFDQTYPASAFPANTEISVMASGFLEFDTGINYYIRVSSDNDFSLKTTSDLVYPWTAGDITLIREDDMLQIRSYDSRNNGIYIFVDGEDWTIQNKKIYICNTTGTQTGTFASNGALWDILGTTSQLLGKDVSVNSLYQPVFGDETGLILDIPFEQFGTDTIQEDKSLSHEGVGSGGVIVSADNGQYGSGGLFDGIDDKIDILYDAILNPVIFTAEVRVKVTGGAGTFRSPLTSREASPKKGYTIYASETNNWQLLFSNGTTSWRELNGPAVVLDKWTNVSISYDGTTMSLYVNGDLVDSAISSYSPNTQFPTRIGAGATEGSGQFFFNGCIDHVKIYSRALAIEEIRTPYLRHGGKSVIKSDSLRVIDSSNNVLFEVSSDLFKYNDANGGRVLIDVSKIQLVSPDGSALVNIRNNDFEFYIAAQLMLELNAISAKVTSPDGTKKLTVNNDGVNADSSLYQSIFGDESQLMLDIPFSHGGTNITQFNRGNRENILSGFGGVVTSSFNGPFNGPSATFNGTTAYMNNLILEGINLNAFQNLTVEGWAKSTDITTGNYMWILEGTHASDWESFLLEPTGSNQVGVFFRDGTDAIGVTILATVDDVTQWHRYTVILDRDADVIKIYVDGVLKNTGSISSESAGFTQPIKLGLGALPDGSGNFWQGQQTEFRVYNKKLSLDEIRIYYARTGGDSVIQGDVFRTVNLFNHVNLEVSEYLFNYIDSGTSRIIADATKTKSVSPDGSKSHEINNSGQLLTGLKSGTLASPPSGLAIDEIWEDTTNSATHPIIRKSTVET